MGRNIEKKVSEKIIWITIGIAITLSAIFIINALPISFAHINNGNNLAANSMMNRGMMQNNMMSMMHHMIGDSEGIMGNCISMMKNHAEMTQEEIDVVLKAMDKDNDGQCDMCGMSIEASRKMMSL